LSAVWQVRASSTFQGPTTEAAFRYGGTLLEFFGILLVAFGLDHRALPSGNRR
jgi:hypothetical protein